jgi:hypothetical protein
LDERRRLSRKCDPASQRSELPGSRSPRNTERKAAHAGTHDQHIWRIYNRDPSHLQRKMFAFFKRKPRISRSEALRYYRTTHADVGESVNKHRTVRYLQNHVIDGYRNPNAAHDYDGGRFEAIYCTFSPTK